MGKKSPQSKKPVVSQEYKCSHCKFAAKTQAGLTKHNKAKHDGIKSKVGARGEKKEGERQSEQLLSPQQEMFCQLYASDKEFFGNGVQSYIEAYDVDVGKGKGQTSYEACKAYAHRLLTNPKILKRINEVFEGRGLNDAFVDKQLEKLITQDAEFRPKLGAIAEYNKLKKRTTDTVQHVHAFADIKGMSDDELRAEREKLINFFNKK